MPLAYNDLLAFARWESPREVVDAGRSNGPDFYHRRECVHGSLRRRSLVRLRSRRSRRPLPAHVAPVSRLRRSTRSRPCFARPRNASAGTERTRRVRKHRETRVARLPRPARFARGTVERRRRRLSEFEPDPDVLARVTRCARLVGSKSLVTISRLAVSLVARRYRSVPLGGLLVVEMRRPGFSRAKRARSRATHDRRECVGRD